MPCGTGAATATYSPSTQAQQNEPPGSGSNLPPQLWTHTYVRIGMCLIPAGPRAAPRTPSVWHTSPPIVGPYERYAPACAQNAAGPAAAARVHSTTDPAASPPRPYGPSPHRHLPPQTLLPCTTQAGRQAAPGGRPTPCVRVPSMAGACSCRCGPVGPHTRRPFIPGGPQRGGGRWFGFCRLLCTTAAYASKPNPHTYKPAPPAPPLPPPQHQPRRSRAAVAAGRHRHRCHRCRCCCRCC